MYSGNSHVTSSNVNQAPNLARECGAASATPYTLLTFMHTFCQSAVDAVSQIAHLPDEMVPNCRGAPGAPLFVGLRQTLVPSPPALPVHETLEEQLLADGAYSTTLAGQDSL